MEDRTDYDEPKSSGGDSHEDEFDDEYGAIRTAPTMHGRTPTKPTSTAGRKWHR
jgi:hypothetical protein